VAATHQVILSSCRGMGARDRSALEFGQMAAMSRAASAVEAGAGRCFGTDGRGVALAAIQHRIWCENSRSGHDGPGRPKTLRAEPINSLRASRGLHFRSQILYQRCAYPPMAVLVSKIVQANRIPSFSAQDIGRSSSDAIMQGDTMAPPEMP